ncbi:hypothetical protein ACJRO7_006964 [Eucalyptus globulus]|uniref:F-box domain-containing protein n=1 Tax=Eucalyptus globulus TaxID=34317 RepID=A0ABD3IN11_EUCGL
MSGTGTDRSDRDRGGDDPVDRISGLPTALLTRILSFLGTRDAVRTSMLHRPFAHLWRSLSNLDFCDDDFDDGGGDPRAHAHRCSRFAVKVSTLLETPEFESLHFHVDFHAGDLEYDHELAGRLDRSIHLALERRLKRLSGISDWLVYDRVPSSYYKLPSEVLRSTTLVGLHLSCCNVRHLGQIQIGLPSLQHLSMTNVNLRDELLLDLVSGSPSLKKLELEECHGLRVLNFRTHPSLVEFMVCSCDGLERLDLSRSGVKILVVHKSSPLNITCPQVETLELDGTPGEMDLTCGPSLKEVALFFGGVSRLDEYRQVRRLLSKLQNVEHITLCNAIVSDFTTAKLMMQQPVHPSFSWKRLTLVLNLAEWHLPGIALLLESCCCLETLTIYVYPPSAQDIEEIEWELEWNIDELLHENSSIFYLQNFMVYACVTNPIMIKLIQYVLSHASFLKKIVISSKREFGSTRGGNFYYFDEEDYSSDQLLEFSKKLLSVSRSSPRAVVLLE